MLLLERSNRKSERLRCGTTELPLTWLISLANSKLFYIGVLAIAVFSLVGCQPPEISIIDVEKKKSGKTVYLTGKVIHLAPFVDNAAYKLQDNTGSVWVVTSKTPPTLKAMVSIKGKIQYQSLPFAETELGDFYVIELQQLEAPLK